VCYEGPQLKEGFSEQGLLSFPRFWVLNYLVGLEIDSLPFEGGANGEVKLVDVENGVGGLPRDVSASLQARG